MSVLWRGLARVLSAVTGVVLGLVVIGLLAWIVAELGGYHAPASPLSRGQTLGGTDGRLLPAPEVPDEPGGDRYSFLHVQRDGTTPIGFDPCHVAHYVIRDGGGAGEEGRRVIADAVAEVSEASGIAFVDDGWTDERPSVDRPVSQPARYGNGWSPILIVWSTPHESGGLDDEVIGEALGQTVRAPSGSLQNVTGQIHLDTETLLQYLRTGREDIVRAVVMHELGHVLGAGHASSDGQVMSEHAGRTSWGDGDRYALAMLGRGTCIPGT